MRENAERSSVWQSERSRRRFEYSHNDRVRGEHVVAMWKLGANDVPVEYAGSGNDYMKEPAAGNTPLCRRQDRMEMAMSTTTAGARLFDPRDLSVADGIRVRGTSVIGNVGVLKGGKVYDPARIERALGIAPCEER